ncbi:unnamed protein product [Adineta steineri]|uniref:Uncharacterized protein n=1 Tax=Adineta steineri TaxID=433720 RepID=A0A819X3W3_9BILA|nr:unnamed protein product [Adineta steineri]CAF4136279.1 unnamed protein product [Adineta steineri]
MSLNIFLLCYTILILIQPIFTDIYLHNPRGSNNRHNENTPERANAQLSFDSQNNNRGGYNVGDDGAIYYYANSILPIQWTNQHSCNDVNADCTLILQYTCNDSLRDGASTTTIPVTVAGEQNSTYRLTEDLTSYLNCRVRSRNKNLFTAEQNLGSSSTSTRQNPAGTRYGYECPEERDYYPYWQPTNWIDIAILTNRQDLCSYYRQNSQNIQSRFACTFASKDILIAANNLGIIIPNNKEQCEAFSDSRLNGTKPSWVEYPSLNQPAPECYTPPYTRENHLGDIFGSDMPVYNWTLPNISAKKCVLRVRYNISTTDYDSWNINSTSNLGNLYVMKEYFANESTAQNRGYRYQTNPQIQLFDGVNLTLQLAINTQQYGRVFQDRSFTFEIRQRPTEYQDRPIYNLNVRGRRGNIVQVYPALEYDFVPNRLEIPPNSYVHIQWIGSNTTPPGAGQGNQQIDRNNLLLLTNKKINPNWNQFQYLNFTGLYIANLPELLNQSTFLNLSLSDLRNLAASGQNTDPLLLNATAYFDLGPRLVTDKSAGIYHYVSTRNNDFSNRDQKGRIIVQPFQFNYQTIGQNTYTTKLEDTTVIFPEGSVNTTVPIKLSKFSRDQLSQILPINGQNIVNKQTLFDSVYVVEPYDLQFSSNIQFQIPFQELNNDQKNVDVLQFEPTNGVYLKLLSTLDTNNRVLKFQSDTAGVFVFVEKSSSSIWVAGVVIPIVLIVIIIISTVIYFRLSPNRYIQVKDQLTKTKRSFFSRV